jgi:hypothetical protein
MIQWLCGFLCRRQGDNRQFSAAGEIKAGAVPPPRFRREPFPFSNLPVDLQQGIVLFLTANEALRLCQTSKRIRSGLTLTTRQPFRILDESYWLTEPGSGPEKGTPQHIATIIPVFGTNLRHTHSVTVTCEWCDPGVVGTGQSQLFIVAHGVDDDDLSMASGSVLAESGYSPRTLSKLVLSFRPKRGEMYYLWYTIGCHQLYVRDVFVHTLVFDDPC